MKNMNKIKLKMKQHQLKTFCNKLVLSFVCVSLLLFGSVSFKPLEVHADENITETNGKNIFVNLAVMLMGTLGIKAYASSSGLASGFADSLVTMFDNWLTSTGTSLSTIVSALNARLSVKKQNNTSYLDVGGLVYNYVTQFLTYLNGNNVFTTDVNDYPFVYDVSGSYYTNTVDNPLLFANSAGYNYYSYSNGARFVLLRDGNLVIVYFVSLSRGLVAYTSQVGSSSSVLSKNINTAHTFNNVTFYSTTGNYNFSPSSVLLPYYNVSDYYDISYNIYDIGYYLTFGAGAVGGTDGTIGLPDAISRNKDTPFPAIDDSDSFPLALPNDFVTSFPLDSDTDIPLVIPQVIPYVFDVPTDVPIDIPFSPFIGAPIPPATVPVPDILSDIPLIVSPECETLSACIVEGARQVSSDLNHFIEIVPNMGNYVAVSLGVGFALYLLGVLV